MTSNEELLNSAKIAAENAYCVYSNFPVGACVLYSSGNTYTGCNIENASYGLSLCAERNAISNAIASGEKGDLIKIAIFSPKSKKCFPCGACRQWLKEFEKEHKIEIILENDDSSCITYSLEEIFPYAFKLDMV